MFGRFCNTFSESSPCLLGQHGSCSTAQRPVELSEHMLQNLFHNLTSQTAGTLMREADGRGVGATAPLLTALLLLQLLLLLWWGRETERMGEEVGVGLERDVAKF